MIKTAAVALAALLLCSGCLTKEDLDCWYEDMCLSLDARANPLTAAPPPVAAP